MEFDRTLHVRADGYNDIKKELFRNEKVINM